MCVRACRPTSIHMQCMLSAAQLLYSRCPGLQLPGVVVGIVCWGCCALFMGSLLGP